MMRKLSRIYRKKKQGRGLDKRAIIAFEHQPPQGAAWIVPNFRARMSRSKRLELSRAITGERKARAVPTAELRRYIAARLDAFHIRRAMRGLDRESLRWITVDLLREEKGLEPLPDTMPRARASWIRQNRYEFNLRYRQLGKLLQSHPEPARKPVDHASGCECRVCMIAAQNARAGVWAGTPPD